MNFKNFCAVAAVVVLSACGGGGGGGGGGGTLSASASVGSVPANGTSTTTITVSGGISFPVVLLTEKGTWDNGQKSISFSAAPVAAVLHACNSRTDATCPGSVTVNITDRSGATARVQVAFVAVEICDDGIDNDGNGKIDCEDSACAVGTTCDTYGRVCNAGTPNYCGCVGGEAGICCPGTTDCTDPLCKPATGRPGSKCASGTNPGGLTIYGACTAAGTCTCTGSGTETNCGDGIDNNCDGYIDCDDPDCQPLGNALGGVCDGKGNTCSPKVAGVSTCSRCAPGGDAKNFQASETSCGDGLDNDCNGVADCQDPNCLAQGYSCTSSGMVCTAGSGGGGVCQCPGAGGPETSCADGVDNDCDGFIDCKDLNCNGLSCGPNGKKCSTTTNGTGSCVCPGGIAEICNDGIDNNCDGLVDCADPLCQPTGSNTFGQSCRTTTLVSSAKCNAAGQCACPGGQVQESSCNDGLDNDCNGFPDCLDLSCNGKACGLSGQVCVTSANGAGTCVCPGGSTEICNDGIDNNCDGKADCDDPTCQASTAACNPADAAYKCSNIGTVASPKWACKNTASFTLTVVPAVARLAANGSATTAVTVTLLNATSLPAVPMAGATVSLSADFGSIAPASVITNASGQATATFTSGATAITATITASYASTPPASATAKVTMPGLSQIALADQDFAVMGARDSGYQELNQLTFLLTDSTGQPYPAGLQVDLEHTPSGGSFIEVTGVTGSCTPVLCTTHGVTDATGQVRVLLHSGSTAAILQVTAKASAGGTGQKIFTAGNIAVVGAKANGNQFTITCSPQNIPALISTDCSNSSYFGADATVNCQVVLADRYGLKLGVRTLVQFLAEAGAMGTSATTPPYDPTKTPAQQVGLGTATGVYSAAGAKLPVDVLPQAAEYRFAHDLDGCAPPGGTLVHNPRDGLVTVIAVAQGEEGFYDGSNSCPADGVYNAPGSPGCALGERFVDLGEPFVDINDNGRRDSIAAGDEVDEPYLDVNSNGVWDGPNGVWDSNTVIWAETRLLYTGYVDVLSTATGVEDLSRFYSSIPSPFTPAPTADASFAVLASTTTPAPGTPATSDSKLIYVTDLNFNRPNYKTSYGLSKSAGSKFTTTMEVAPTTADGLGMLFRQLYGDASDPTNQAKYAPTCNFTRCVRRADITQYEYGKLGSVTVTGGNAAEAGCVWVTATLRTTNTISSITTERSINIPVCGTVSLPP